MLQRYASDMQGWGRVMLMKRKEVVLAVLLWLLASCLRHWPDRAELKTSWKSSAVTAMETSTSIPCCANIHGTAICAALSYSQLIQSGLRVASLRIIMSVSSCEVCYVQINNVQLFITVDTKHYRGETEIVYDTLLHRIKTKKVIYLKPNI